MPLSTRGCAILPSRSTGVTWLATLIQWNDFLGRPVELTDEGFEHITSSHPELNAPLGRIQAALTAPDRVTRDAKMRRAECYYRTIGGRVMIKVVVLFRPTPDGWAGEVLTALPTERYDRREEQLWP
jgi:hypothetical protein